MKHNYHTHTLYCHHASHSIEDMIKKAISEGYESIGFSEHAPLLVKRNFRLNQDNYLNYINEANLLKEKYKNKIKVYIGFECEYEQSQYEYYNKLKNTPGIDYLILGNHNMGNPHNAQEWNKNNVIVSGYTKQLIDAVKSGLFSLIAHPDWIYRHRQKWEQDDIVCAKQIIQSSIDYNIPIEFNLNGLFSKKTIHDYPNENFWNMVAKTNAKVIISADAHTASALENDLYQKGLKLAKACGLEKNLIETIKFI